MECMIKKIKEEENNSDIPDSDSESGLEFFQMERNIVSSIGNDIMTKIILHNQAKLNDQLDLKNVILLDNQSTLDLIFNKKSTSKIKKSDKKISIQWNGGYSPSSTGIGCLDTIMTHGTARMQLPISSLWRIWYGGIVSHMTATIKNLLYTEKHLHFHTWSSGCTGRVFTCSIQNT